MRKFYTLGYLFIFAWATLSSQPTMGTPTTVNITGRVIAAACTVDTTLAGGQSVDLGSVGRTNVQHPGQSGQWISFSLKLINCPAGTSKSTVLFTGTPDNTDSTLYANIEPSETAASHIAIQLANDENRGSILSNNSTMTVSIDAASRTAIFPLAARLYTPTGEVSPGKVSATVLVGFTYQ